jgi:Flp pilus assembly protein TadD
VASASWDSTVAKRLPAGPVGYRDIFTTAAQADTLSGLCAQALASHQAGRLGEAITQYERILALKPDFPQVHNNRGLALADLGRLEEAVAAYRRALETKTDDAETLCNWGVALAQLERRHEAEAKFRRVIATNPGFAAAYNNLGLILKETGRIGEAGAAIEEAIRLSPRDAAYYDNLAAIRSFAAGDPYFTALEALAEDASSLSPVNQMHLHFALAKAHEHIGSSEQAFRQLLAGNALKRAQLGYDEAATLAQMDRARELFTRKFIRDRQGSGKQSAVPLFIVGMPRSGTTLIEQILASHPQIFGAGELSLFEQAAEAIGGNHRNFRT